MQQIRQDLLLDGHEYPEGHREGREIQDGNQREGYEPVHED